MTTWSPLASRTVFPEIVISNVLYTEPEGCPYISLASLPEHLKFGYNFLREMKLYFTNYSIFDFPEIKTCIQKEEV